MLFGLAVCLVSAALAAWLGHLQHVVGSPMIGLLIGIVIANTFSSDLLSKLKKGASFSSKYLLKTGIILAGGTLSFKSILGIGFAAMPLIIFNICLSFLIAHLVGRAMGITGNTCTLVGGGTAICGGTAIAALSPIVEAEEHETAYAMTAIFLFDILAALIWPYAAKAMSLSPEQYGILGGLAISDTSSVTAAGATFDAVMGSSSSADIGGETLSGGELAVIVKLTRTVMLVFVAIGVMAVRIFKNGQVSANGQPLAKRAAKAFPLFVVGFLLMAVANTLIGFSEVSIAGCSVSLLLSKAYKFLITSALTGVGLGIKVNVLFTDGLKPILLGGCTWLGVSLAVLTYILFLG